MFSRKRGGEYCRAAPSHGSADAVDTTEVGHDTEDTDTSNTDKDR